MAERVFDDRLAVAAVLDVLADRTPPSLVLIDGPSGAGKSTLADDLVAAWPGAQLLRMDAIVPGWDGLAASSEQLEHILAAWVAGEAAIVEHWDWVADAPGTTSTVDPSRPLVVDGSGSVTARTAAFAAAVVWVDLDDDAERCRRALLRDGEVYEPHWERWAAQERAHEDRHDPRALATLIVDRSG